MNPSKLVLVGRVWRAHGVRGEVKAFPETDSPDLFLELETLHIGATAETAERVSVEGARFQHKKGGRLIVLLKAEGIDDRDEAMALRGQGLYALEEHLPEREEGEVYLHDLIGFEVYERIETSDELKFRGSVSDVVDAAQRHFVVHVEGQPDVLVPDVDPIVEEVDVDERRIIVTPPEGLF